MAISARQAQKDLTQSYLKECLDYNPDTGDFVWRNRPREHFASAQSWKAWNAKYAKNKTGAVNSAGYLQLSLGGKYLKLHRLAWLYMTGAWPLDQIDHINHKKTDNRWENLREASNQENHRNMPTRSDNKSGVTGVHWSAKHNRWVAYIINGGRHKTLGYSRCKDDAVSMRKDAEKYFQFHANHG